LSYCCIVHSFVNHAECGASLRLSCNHTSTFRKNRSKRTHIVQKENPETSRFQGMKKALPLYCNSSAYVDKDGVVDTKLILIHHPSISINSSCVVSCLINSGISFQCCAIAFALPGFELIPKS